MKLGLVLLLLLIISMIAYLIYSIVTDSGPFLSSSSSTSSTITEPPVQVNTKVNLEPTGSGNSSSRPTSGPTPSYIPTPTPTIEPFIKDVRYIDFYSEQPAAINIAEIYATTPYTGNSNIIQNNAPIYTLGNKALLSGYPYTNIIDGKNDTFGHQNLTDNTKDNPFILRIDLQSSKTLDRILVVNRLDCCRQRIVGGRINLRNSNFELLYQSELFKNAEGSVTYSNSIETTENTTIEWVSTTISTSLGNIPSGSFKITFKKSYLYYLIRLPSTKVTGSNSSFPI